MAELEDENMELDQDLQEFLDATSDYQQRFGRSLFIDAVTALNSGDLNNAVQQNPELGQYFQEEMDKFVPVVQELMANYLEDMPSPVAEEQPMSQPETEAGREDINNVEPQM